MRIVSIALSRKKGTRKTVVDEALLVEDYGIKGDAHGGPWHRQVSLLASERIQECRERGLDVTFGDFAENVATEGIDWKTVPIGTRVGLGDSAVLEITQIGKVCHNRCAIYHLAGDCIMPREGIFARVLKGGTIRRGDPLSLDGSVFTEPSTGGGRPPGDGGSGARPRSPRAARTAPPSARRRSRSPAPGRAAP